MYKLSIILPVFNEKETIEIVLREWKQELDKHPISYAFIICEDGSTDGTKELLKQLKERYSLVLNQKNYRRGYGKAVLDGIASAASDYILCIDSDGQCDPNDFKYFWEMKNNQHVLIGWRRMRSDVRQRKIFSKMFKFIFNLLFSNNIHDPSAPFVLFKKDTIKPYMHYLTHLREGFWWGFIGMAVRKRLTIQEISINHRKRIKGRTKIYKLNKIPSIAFRNSIALLKIRFM